MPPSTPSTRDNVSARLSASARLVPDQPALIVCDRNGQATAQRTFRELDQLVDRLATGLAHMGVEQGHRIVLMVRPGVEFLAMTFALFRAGAVVVLIDPGMGLRKVITCLEQADPHGFVAVPAVQWARCFYRRRFPQAKLNVRVGGLAPASTSYSRLEHTTPDNSLAPQIESDDPAAIIFTSGSTGPAKGVEYEHGMFCAQADLLQARFGIRAKERDLPGFPLFALFNVTMGVTTVFPDIDPTRPAAVDPSRIVAPIRAQQVTQAFGSPALWDRVGRHCRKHNITLPSLTRVLSAGAPVPPDVVESIRDALTGDSADIHTPYGATEALPVAVISGHDILEHTAASSAQGKGTCVGTLFPEVDVRIVEIDDEPILDFHDLTILDDGQIGEILVRGPSVTTSYFRRDSDTRASKVRDQDTTWHRMGDVGYLDDIGRLWFCGRKAHRVQTETETLFSVPCEAIFNQHIDVRRSALVGLGQPPHQKPAIIIERHRNDESGTQLARELQQTAAGSTLTDSIPLLLFHDNFPVDIRHNVKINREQLAEWAANCVARCKSPGNDPIVHHLARAV
jgi:acyl-CoA synthetase (AMP-forming)/AMP-acid ligase II